MVYYIFLYVTLLLQTRTTRFSLRFYIENRVEEKNMQKFHIDLEHPQIVDGFPTIQLLLVWSLDVGGNRLWLL